MEQFYAGNKFKFRMKVALYVNLKLTLFNKHIKVTRFHIYLGITVNYLTTFIMIIMFICTFNIYFRFYYGISCYLVSEERYKLVVFFLLKQEKYSKFMHFLRNKICN